MQNSKLEDSNAISVLVYASNDEKNIKRAVDSALLLSSDVILIDIGSTDNTPVIAKKAGAHVVKLKPASYVELVRMEGIKHAKNDWVFILDSDEVISSELAREITSVISGQSSEDTDLITDNGQLISAYRVPRKNYFGTNKWLRHGGWYPDYQTRLIKLSDLKGWSSVIHSTPQLVHKVEHLKQPLLHYSHGDFSQMVQKTIQFEGVESDLLQKAHKHVSTLTFFRKFLGELYRRLIKQSGFLDGAEGFAESIYQAYSKTITYLLLYEKTRRSTK